MQVRNADPKIVHKKTLECLLQAQYLLAMVIEGADAAGVLFERRRDLDRSWRKLPQGTAAMSTALLTDQDINECRDIREVDQVILISIRFEEVVSRDQKVNECGDIREVDYAIKVDITQ